MPKASRQQRTRKIPRYTFRTSEQKPLLVGTDHGSPLTISPKQFAPGQRDGGWGPFAESFLRANDIAFKNLELTPEIAANSQGTVIRLHPGGHAGAMPLRSAQTQHVVGGVVIKPRFGWAGVGSVLRQIGWDTSLDFVDLPMVPGSGREVPPWVIAGPVISRLAALLAQSRRGYRDAHEVLTKPRGKINWNEYISGPVRAGKWHHLPCEFPELSDDPQLRAIVKWCLERLRRDLLAAGGNDKLVIALISVADRLMDLLRDIHARAPRKVELDQRIGGSRFEHEAIQRGIESIAWVMDERGLGGGRELDGLAWHLPLPQLWESYVETVVRKEAVLIGAEVRCARKHETVFPIRWTDAGLRGMSHLVPDFVVRHRDHVRIVDAKYKSHYTELDEGGWLKMAEDVRESHRADFHQVLAYASLFEAKHITASLVYPLRLSTFEALSTRKRDVVRADLSFGGRTIVAELRGLPFGGSTE